MSNPQTPADWKKTLTRFEASGLTQVDFCKREGIGIWSLRKWRERVGRRPAPEPGFIEIPPPSERRVPPGPSTSLVVELPGGIVLRFEGLPQ